MQTRKELFEERFPKKDPRKDALVTIEGKTLPFSYNHSLSKRLSAGIEVRNRGVKSASLFSFDLNQEGAVIVNTEEISISSRGGSISLVPGLKHLSAEAYDPSNPVHQELAESENGVVWYENKVEIES